ncbi:MAG: general glycosylation pathway protein [Campylobacter sp.]|nr:general glycosylation pathway protein [Campylobacter sp.]
MRCNTQNLKAIIYTLVAYIFSVAVRYIWVSWASGIEEFFWNGELMINTNDGYAFAEGARDRIAGFHQENDLSYFNHSLAKLTSWFSLVLPMLKFETIILYMSAFFSSLIVVPLILIAKELKCLEAGLIGALIASIAMSYYNRTMIGYFDTDMLNVVLPMFVLWGIIRVLKSQKIANIIIAPIFMLISLWWYSASYSLNALLIGIFLLYTLIFDRKNILNYKLLVLMLIVISGFSLQNKIITIALLFAFFCYKKNSLDYKVVAGIGIVVLGALIISGGLNPIIRQLSFYVVRGEVTNTESLFYFNVSQTIQEAGIVDYDMFLRRISSHPLIFLLSGIGLFLAIFRVENMAGLKALKFSEFFRYKELILALPILALGFLAVKAGLRFTIYAVPIMAFGFGYFAYFVGDFVKKALINETHQQIAKVLFMVLLTIGALIPSINHINGYKSFSVFFQDEVEVLDELKRVADREDYVLAWWDYGYPIRYYSDVKTLVDGGKHLGNHNFGVSFALLNDEVSSANMARLEVEYTEQNFTQKFGDIHLQMMEDYGFDDINSFLISLKDENFKLPPKTRDIYYYLPNRMLDIFSVVAAFSNLDLKTGESYADGFLFSSFNVKTLPSGVDIGSGLNLSVDLKWLNSARESLPIASFIITKQNGNEVELKIQDNHQAGLYAVFMSDYGRMLVMDEKMFNSTFIQIFVLQIYDKELFEPVIINPFAKVYKLKR